jgi:hypothetical protein
MNVSPDDHLEHQLEFLRGLLVENASIGGDVLEIGDDAWAIHGVIPVDGEVLMAGFDTYDDAIRVLDQLRSGFLVPTLPTEPDALLHPPPGGSTTPKVR